MEAERETAAHEVIVVGAGAIGLSIGWRLAQRGSRTLVLDAGAAGERGDRRRCRDARSGHGGRLRRGGADRAEPREPAAAGPRSSPSCKARAGIDCGYRESGTLTVAVDRDEDEALRRLHGYQRSLGLDAPWLSARECRALEPGLAPRVAGGIHAPHDHQVSPRPLARALAAALGAAGGELRTGARVVRARAAARAASRSSWRRASRLDAGAVVIAAGAESGDARGSARGRARAGAAR